MKNKLLLAIAVLFLFSQADAALLQGSVFEWYSLEKINNVIIDINSVPAQRIVAKTGQYALQLQKGDYLLQAQFFEDNALKYEASEAVSISSDGNFLLDLIMFPASDTDLNELIEPGIDANVELPGTAGQVPQGLENGKTTTESFNLAVSMAIIVVLLIVILFFAFGQEMRGRVEKRIETAKATGEQQTEAKAKPEQKTEENLDKYAQEVLRALKTGGNRLTQKELREKVQSVGEAKISLILTELESEGKIKKIKKGRGNIIVLKNGA